MKSEKLPSGMDLDEARRMFGNPLGLLGPIKGMIRWLTATGKGMYAKSEKVGAELAAKEASKKNFLDTIGAKDWWRLITIKPKSKK